MKNISKVIFPALFLLMVSCSDGTQVSKRINQLVKDHEIEKLVVDVDGQVTEYELPKKGEKPGIIVEEQFLFLNDEYINLNRTRTIKVKDKALEIKL